MTKKKRTHDFRMRENFFTPARSPANDQAIQKTRLNSGDATGRCAQLRHCRVQSSARPLHLEDVIDRRVLIEAAQTRDRARRR
jgi:hypothetical protein